MRGLTCCRSYRDRTTDFNFPAHEGTLLASRYEVQAFLGKGSFGKVVKCADTVTNTKSFSNTTTMSSGNAKIGKPAPDFKATAVVNGQFKDIQLSDYKGSMYFFFYPWTWHLCAPLRLWLKGQGRGVPQSRINTPRKQGGLGNMNIPLVADLTKTISRDYGVLKDDNGIAYSVSAGWKPGSDTIILDVEKSKSSFSKHRPSFESSVLLPAADLRSDNFFTALRKDRINTPRKQGGLGNMNIPLVADLTKTISTDYGVLKEDDGIAYRGLFVIDDKGILRQITINDLPVGRFW
ncbi:peroxiredoxin-1-like protein [Lates japonicus]|uniref:thioredoxin-dependent peroxiredoxin n=1 Tax=Lates japonicus TaxID=270547 RepID=A0AAD3RAL4_LATJO|nr:peroxiredoxin-1-like protein [Lates japonicus]